jgi:sulfoxide reductase heme-binding subunit YedZ
MSRGQPIQYLWWLVSRASGILALVLITLSVVLGLMMAGKVLRRPNLKRGAVRLHEHLAVIAVAAIGAHGLALLGDHWLEPGWRGITIPFALGYRPAFTGIGIIAGYLTVLLGPSFYLRRRIGARRWRKLHRAIVVVWLMSVVHALGAGSDGTTLWLRAIVILPVAPVVYLLVVRVVGAERRPAKPASGRPGPVPARPSGAGGRYPGSSIRKAAPSPSVD